MPIQYSQDHYFVFNDGNIRPTIYVTRTLKTCVPLGALRCTFQQGSSLLIYLLTSENITSWTVQALGRPYLLFAVLFFFRNAHQIPFSIGKMGKTFLNQHSWTKKYLR